MNFPFLSFLRISVHQVALCISHKCTMYVSVEHMCCLYNDSFRSEIAILLSFSHPSLSPSLFFSLSPISLSFLYVRVYRPPHEARNDPLYNSLRVTSWGTYITILHSAFTSWPLYYFIVFNISFSPSKFMTLQLHQRDSI